MISKRIEGHAHVTLPSLVNLNKTWLAVFTFNLHLHVYCVFFSLKNVLKILPISLVQGSEQQKPRLLGSHFDVCVAARTLLVNPGSAT